MILAFTPDETSPEVLEETEGTVDELAELFRPEVGPKGGTAFIPARFRVPYRLDENVEEVTALVIDVDHVSPQVGADLVRRVISGPHRAFLWETFSHTEDEWCMRVVFPFERPCPAATWRPTRARLLSGLGFASEADPSCANPSRLYFLCRHPGGQTRALHEHRGERLLSWEPFEGVKGLAPTADYHRAPAPPARDLPEARQRVRSQLGKVTRVRSQLEKLARGGGEHAGHLGRLLLGQALADDGARYAAWLGVTLILANALREVGITDPEEAIEILHALGEASWRREVAETPDKPHEWGPVETALRSALVKVETEASKTAALAKAFRVNLPSTQEACAPGTPAESSAEALEAACRYPIGAADFTGVARAFIARRKDAEGLSGIVRSNGEFFEHEGACYRPVSNEELGANMRRFVEESGAVWASVGEEADPRPPQTSTRLLNEYLTATAHEALTKGAAPSWVGGEGPFPASEAIAFPNGILHPRTGQFIPPTRRLFTLNAVPYAFDVSALLPSRWLRFLDEIFGDDVEAIETLQELFGYVLSGDTRQQKLFLIVGPKRSGKGTLMRILRAMIGAENTCGPTINGLAGTFGVEGLIGKTLAVISDARLGRGDVHVIAERLLTTSGEDAVSVSRKNRGDWVGTLRARIVILANEVPALLDQSGALASRFVILTMGRSFYGAEDLGLTDALLKELPGILQWALAGLARLNQRGHFRQPRSGVETLEALEELASPVKAFVRERIEVRPGAQSRCDQVFGAWQMWCLASGRQAGTEAMLGKHLRAAFPALKVTRPREGERRARFYEGLHLVQAGPGGPLTQVHGEVHDHSER